MRVTTLFGSLTVPFDFSNGFRDFLLAQKVFHDISVSGQNGIFSIIQNHGIFGMVDESVEIGTNKFDFITDSQHQGRLSFSAKNLLGKVGGNKRQRKGSFNEVQHFHKSFFHIATALIKLLQKMGKNFRIRFRRKLKTFLLQLVSQGTVIGNNSIVNQRKISITGSERVGIVLRHLSVCCPTSMGNAYLAFQLEDIVFTIKLFHSTDIFFGDEAGFIHQGNTTGVIAPVFQVPNPLKKKIGYIF